MFRNASSLLFLFLIGSLRLVAAGQAVAVVVRDARELREAVAQARPGHVISLEPGHYGHGFLFAGVAGTPEQRIVIQGADLDHPPLFEGGNQALHFSGCSYVTLRNVRVRGSRLNGVNADDGGRFDTPSRGMVFERLSITEIGPQGNHDGLKLSGLADFTVRDSFFSGWGGSGIDMVGCRDGVIEGCRFVGQSGFSQSNAIQAKGGTERIVIRQSNFDHAGLRTLNLGGHTGLAFFRPYPRDFEARDILVAGNRFFGSDAPIAFVTSRNITVRRNTFIRPSRWVIRILQEQPLETFQPCRDGIFEENLVVFDHRQIRAFVSVGANTRPDTFVFRGNAWHSLDGDRRPELPVAETGGIYQVDPMLTHLDSSDAKPQSADPRILGVGAHAYAQPDR